MSSTIEYAVPDIVRKKGASCFAPCFSSCFCFFFFGQRRGMITCEEHMKRLKWPTPGISQAVPLVSGMLQDGI